VIICDVDDDVEGESESWMTIAGVVGWSEDYGVRDLRRAKSKLLTNDGSEIFISGATT
jgi:hypothetical protein